MRYRLYPTAATGIDDKKCKGKVAAKVICSAMFAVLAVAHATALSNGQIRPTSRQTDGQGTESRPRNFTLESECSERVAHVGEVSALSFLPDARMLVSAGKDGTLKFWDISSTTLVEYFFCDKFAITAVTFTPDGGTLITGNSNGEIEVWSLPGLVRRYKRAHDKPNAGPLHLEVQRFSLRGGSGRKEIETPREAVQVLALAVSPDGSLLASAGIDGSLKLWNLANGNQLRKWKADSVGIHDSLSFDASGAFLARPVSRGIQIWRVADQRLMQVIPVFNAGGARAFGCGNTLLATGQITIVSLLTGRITAEFKVMRDNGVNSLAINSQGNTLASGTGSGAIQLWDLKEKRPIACLVDPALVTPGK